MLGNFRRDPVHTGRHIHAVHHRFLISVVLDDVLIKESIGFGCRRSSQTENMCISEVVEYCFPLAVNGAMAFIDDNQLKIVRRNPQVIAELHGHILFFLRILCGFLIFRIFAGFTQHLTGHNCK